MRRAKVFLIAALMMGTALVFVCGCASSLISTASMMGGSGTSYRAFGDSITAGGMLADRATEAYPVLVAKDERVGFANRAIDGDQACDIAPRQMFADGASAKLPTHLISSVLIGTNDVDVRGAGSYEPVFIQCQLAVLAWLAVPAGSRLVAGGDGFEASGPGAMDTASGWNEWTTQGQGATVSFTIRTKQAGAIYAWPVVDDDSAATYTYGLDGEVLGVAAAKFPVNIATKNGTTRSLGFLRIADVPAGRHTVTFTQTNAGVDGVSVVAVGASAVDGALPAVLVGSVPFQWQTGAKTGCKSSDAPCQAYNADIAANVSLLVGDGLDVRLFDTRKYLKGTTEDMADAIHPNAQGHKELREAVESVWNAGK